ncbi:hypothetical protein CEXT_544901 [Caerostris extrusa]|uniref:Uncharacterized protein n=1 Tax=Caerostris extrusa TaxID=172846 RepID=A0AAV4N1J2_CAEEX|nr:hypothetical protein CEXT_544901 [Caerostris extrusa]
MILGVHKQLQQRLFVNTCSVLLCGGDQSLARPIEFKQTYLADHLSPLGRVRSMVAGQGKGAGSPDIPCPDTRLGVKYIRPSSEDTVE